MIQHAARHRSRALRLGALASVALVGFACGGEQRQRSPSGPSPAASTAEAAPPLEVRVTGGSAAERAVMRQVLESLGSPDVVAVEVTAPDLNAAGVLGEGVIVTVRAPAASEDGTADGIARFVGAEIAAGYRDRAWAAKLAQPVSYGVQLQRPDGKVEDGTGGEVAPVGGDDDFSVPEPVSVSSQEAAALERLVVTSRPAAETRSNG